MMTDVLADQIIAKINQANELYHRLVLIVAPSGSGKTAALQEVARRMDLQRINVNLELSRCLLELTERQRSLQVPRLLGDIATKHGEVILLDNIELLFDVSLMLDPLRLLQSIARNQTVVAAWNGSVDKTFLTYAAPDHPEYHHYPARDLLVASPESAA